MKSFSPGLPTVGTLLISDLTSLVGIGPFRFPVSSDSVLIDRAMLLGIHTIFFWVTKYVLKLSTVVCYDSLYYSCNVSSFNSNIISHFFSLVRDLSILFNFAINYLLVSLIFSTFLSSSSFIFAPVFSFFCYKHELVLLFLVPEV